MQKLKLYTIHANPKQRDNYTTRVLNCHAASTGGGCV